MSDCIFCRIAAGEIPADVVASDEHFVAFRDLHPLAPVHVLVIPRRARRLDGRPRSDCRPTPPPACCRSRPASPARPASKTSGYRLLTNTGADAGQEVMHLHWHVIGGRSTGRDGLMERERGRDREAHQGRHRRGDEGRRQATRRRRCGCSRRRSRRSASTRARTRPRPTRLAVLKRERKRRLEAIELYRQGGRDELADGEAYEESDHRRLPARGARRRRDRAPRRRGDRRDRRRRRPRTWARSMGAVMKKIGRPRRRRGGRPHRAGEAGRSRGMEPTRPSSSTTTPIALTLAGEHDANLKVLEGALALPRLAARQPTASRRRGLRRRSGDVRSSASCSTVIGQGLPVDAATVASAVDIVVAEHGKPSEVYSDIVWSHRGRQIGPRTSNQKRYVDAIRKNTITFGIGPAGTGKTYLAVADGGARLLRQDASGASSSRGRRSRRGRASASCRGRSRRRSTPTSGRCSTRSTTWSAARSSPGWSRRARSRSRRSPTCAGARSTTRSSSSTRRRTPRPSRSRCSSRGSASGRRWSSPATSRRSTCPRGAPPASRSCPTCSATSPTSSFVEFDQKDVVRHKLVQRIVAAYKEYGERADGAPPGGRRPVSALAVEVAQPDALRRRRRRCVARLARHVLEAEGVTRGELGVQFVGEHHMRLLNRDHRGEDHVTDVLAFPLERDAAARRESRCAASPTPSRDDERAAPARRRGRLPASRPSARRRGPKLPLASRGRAAARPRHAARRRLRPRGRRRADGAASGRSSSKRSSRRASLHKGSRQRTSLLQSFNFAFEGIIHVLRTQRNMRIHFVVAFLVARRRPRSSTSRGSRSWPCSWRSRSCSSPR